MLGRGRQTILCPRGTDHPAIGFLREPQPSPAPFPVLLLNSQSKHYLWCPSAHQLGPFCQALTALIPAQASQ